MTRRAPLSAVLAAALLLPACVCAVDIYAYAIADTKAGEVASASKVAGCVSDLNLIYSQIGVPFTLASYSVVTNDAFYRVVYTNAHTWTALCDYTNNTGGIELYFVGEIDGQATAFHTKKGIVVGPNATARTVSHEVGHAFGWKDIYVNHGETSLVVEGPPSKERLPVEWSPFYPRGTMQADVIPRLLMYGRSSETKADIPGGDIYGLWYVNRRDASTGRWTRDWRLSLAPVGAFGESTRLTLSE